jgi:predicted DNA-binding protein (UPF0251 family)
MGPYIDPRQLEIVLVMAEELNTRKAAERLKVHQSTVSKGITTTGTFTNAATSNVKGFDVEARYSFDPGIPRGSELSH